MTIPGGSASITGQGNADGRVAVALNMRNRIRATLAPASRQDGDKAPITGQGNADGRVAVAPNMRNRIRAMLVPATRQDGDKRVDHRPGQRR